MLKIFKDAFKISFDNLILSTPPLLFTALILLYSVVAERYINNLFNEFIVLLVMISMFSVLISGWGYMVKLAVNKQTENNDKKNKDEESLKLINEFSAGVGEYFIPCLFYVIGTIFLFFLVIACAYGFCLKFIGSVGIDFMTYIKGVMSFSSLKTIMAAMSKEQFIKFSNWTLVTGIFTMIFALFTMFWPVEIFYKTKNVLKALYYSILDVFTKPQIIIIFLTVIITNSVLSVINVIALKNIFLLFVVTLFYFYFIVYVFVLLFLYYERKIQSNSDSISDSDGKK